MFLFSSPVKIYFGKWLINNSDIQIQHEANFYETDP